MAVRDVPLLDRKEVLRVLLHDVPTNGAVQYSEHLEAKGSDIFKNACALELEGVVSKRKDRSYRSGRNAEWVRAGTSGQALMRCVGMPLSGTSTW